MKRRIGVSAISAASALAFAATPVLAQSIDPRLDEHISATTPAVCGVTAAAPDQTLSVPLVNNDGFVDGPTVQSAIVTALNEANVHGFCNGTNNTVVLTRTPFTLEHDGGAVGDFAKAVLYDVQASFSDNSQTYTESTADGPAGGTTAGAFGPSGPGAPITFSTISGGAGGALVTPISVVVSNPDDTSPTAAFTNRPTARLVAGAYASTLTLKLTPGL
jgi:hypothetical protein